VLLELNILSNKTNTGKFLDGDQTDESGFWYNKPEVNGMVGNLIRSLKAFAGANSGQDGKGFMIKINEFDEEPFSMNAVLGGYIKSNKFLNPPPPPAPIVQNIYTDGFSFTMVKQNEFITKLNVSVTDVLEDRTHHVFKDISEVPVNEEVEVVVEGLKSAHLYSYQVQYVTVVGVGPASPPSDTPFTTRPSSPPQKLIPKEITPNQITVGWQTPADIATHINLTELLYRVNVEGSNGFSIVKITSNQEFTLSDPEPATAFTFEICSVLNRELSVTDSGLPVNYTRLPVKMNVNFESNPASMMASSLPIPPKIDEVLPEEVDQTSALVRWNPGALAPDALLLSYVVEFNNMNENGSENFRGTEESYAGIQENQINMENLTPGSVYSVRVKAVTSKGDSEFSSNLLFMTEFDNSDIESTKDKLMAEIEELKNSATGHISFCGWWTPSGTEVFLKEDSVDSGSTMDGNGIFTAGLAGTYQVSVSLQLETMPAQSVNVWVKHGEIIEETKIHAETNTLNSKSKTDITGRSIILELGQGDEVSLAVDDSNIPLGNAPFCVSSVKI